MRFNHVVAGGELRLTQIEDVEVLLQGEEMLGPVMPGQRGDDLRV